jgi:NAD+ diphosphatase
VAREVAEETAVVVDRVDYRGSQPWPFPASLMLAFRGHAASTPVTPDGREVTEARWFTRDELAAATRAGEVLLPMRTSVAYALITDWFGAPLPTRW